MKNILFLMFVALSWPALSADIQGKVVRILDGDTLEILNMKRPVRVRLADIDAPEKKQAYGRWSAEVLKFLVAGKSVTVSYTQRDRYGRILGQVYAPDGLNVNRFMVQAGAAWVYTQYNTDPALPALQDEARHQRRGLWADRSPMPPWTWRHRR